MSKLINVPINKIRENKEALRKVNREKEEYKQLVDSVRTHGIMNSITVRELMDPVSGEQFYGLIDGLHRYNAAKDVGLGEIPGQILSMSDADVLEAQVLANVHKIETKPIEYTKQLVKILNNNPLLTVAQLAGKLSKSPGWVKQRLGLLDLTPELQKLVDENTLGLSNAFLLSQLPTEEQTEWVDRAIAQSPQEFIPAANQRVKQIKEEKRKGRDSAKSEFEPVAWLRKLSELKEELEKGTDTSSILVGVNDPVMAFRRGLEYAMHMDPVSVTKQKEDYEKLKKQKEEAKVRRQAEREEKKRREAAEIGAVLSV